MIERPHLLWINQFALLPSDGGGTRHFEIGRELLSRGWRVTIAAADFHLHRRSYTRRAPGEKGIVREEVDGVEILWLPTAPYRRNDWRRFRNWLSFAREVKALRHRLEPDIVIGSSPQLFAAAAAERLAHRLGVPFLFEVRDLWPESLLAAGGRKGIGYRGLDLVAQRLYRVSDRIIVLARGSGEHLVSKGVDRDRLSYIPNGVDPSAFSRSGDRATAKGAPPEGATSGEKGPEGVHGESSHEERRESGPLRLLYAGAHGPANGLEAVLDAAERLAAEGRAIEFLLVGDGPTKSALRETAARRGIANVHFLDPRPKPELARLLATVDGGLMILRPSPLFAFGVSPNKLFDYMAAGLPVLCNVPGEVATMVADAGAGIQTADASGTALADAAVALEGIGAQARREMGEAGARWVVREHGRSVLADRLDGLLRDVLREGGDGR